MDMTHEEVHRTRKHDLDMELATTGKAVADREIIRSIESGDLHARLNAQLLYDYWSRIQERGYI